MVENALHATVAREGLGEATDNVHSRQTDTPGQTPSRVNRAKLTATALHTKLRDGSVLQLSQGRCYYFALFNTSSRDIMDLYRGCLCGLLVAAVVCVLLPAAVDGGCAEKAQCCKGKNNHCRAEGPRMNKSNRTTCFCDEHCLATGDCCTDFTDVCKRESFYSFKTS